MYTEENNQGRKSYQTASGPFAWLADIEITREPYLAAFALMVLTVVLSRLPFYEVSLLGESVAFAFHQIEDLKWISNFIVVLNVASIAALMFPMLKYFEWKYIWFIPTAATAAAELGTAVYFIVKVKDALKNTMIGLLYDMTAAELHVTFSGWLLILVIVATLACSVKMLIDIKNNVRYY